MKYMDKSIEELHEMLVKGEVTSEELVKESLERSHEIQDKCNAFVTILDDTTGGEVTDSLLSGIPYINEQKIIDGIKQITYPIYHLDCRCE